MLLIASIVFFCLAIQHNLAGDHKREMRSLVSSSYFLVIAILVFVFKLKSFWQLTGAWIVASLVFFTLMDMAKKN